MKKGTRILYTLVSAGLLAALLPVAGCSPTEAPSTKIVFSSYTEDGNDIYSINANGSSLKNLTNTPEQEKLFLYCSPFSSKVLYTLSAVEYENQACIVDSDGTKTRKLTKEERLYQDFTWSNDGRYLACVERNTKSLYIIDPDSGKTRLLLNYEDYIASVRWSPDDTGIAFIQRVGRSSRYDLCCIDVKTGHINNVIEFSNPSPSSFSWSTDSKKIVCSSRTDNLSERTTDIYIVDIEDGSRTRVTNDGYDNNIPVWSPDEKQLAFVTYTDYDTKIQMIDIDGTNVTTVYMRTSPLLDLVWLPEGDKFSFRVASPDEWYGGTMFILDLQNADIPAEIEYVEISWNHDYSKAVFTERGTQNIHVYTVADHSIQQITDNTVGRCFYPRWSQ